MNKKKEHQLSFSDYKISFVGNDSELEKALKSSEIIKSNFEHLGGPTIELLGSFFKNNISGEIGNPVFQNSINQFEQLIDIWNSNKQFVEFFAQRLKLKQNNKVPPDALVALTNEIVLSIPISSLDYANKIKDKFATDIRTIEDIQYLKSQTGIFLYELKNIEQSKDISILFDPIKEEESIITSVVKLNENNEKNILSILCEIHQIQDQRSIIEKITTMKISMRSLYYQLNNLVNNENYEIIIVLIDSYVQENKVEDYERLLGSHLSTARSSFLSNLINNNERKIEKKHNEVFERLLYNLTNDNYHPNFNGDDLASIKQFLEQQFKQHFIEMIESVSASEQHLKKFDRSAKQVEMFKLGFLNFIFLHGLFESLNICLSQVVAQLNSFWGEQVYEKFIDFIENNVNINEKCIKQYQLLKEPCHFISGILNYVSKDKLNVEMNGITINEIYYRYLRVLLALNRNSEDDIKRFFIESKDKYSETYTIKWLLELFENRIYEILYTEVTMISISDLLKIFSIMETLMQQYFNFQTTGQIQEITKQIIIQTQPTSWIESIKGIDQVLFFLKYQKYDDINQTYQELLNNHNKNYQQIQKKIINNARGIYKSSFFKEDFAKLFVKINEIEPKDVLVDNYFFGGQAIILRDLVEVIKIFMSTMKEQYKMLVLPHHVQIIAVLQSILCIQDQRNAIFQIGTGEGKSLVIAMLASFIIKTKKARRIHIMINNVALIERDYNSFSKAYENLGIVASTSIKSPGYIKEHQVYYCTVDAMQAMNQNIQDSERLQMYKDSILLVDEVDNIIIDNNINTTYVYEEKRKTLQMYHFFEQRQRGLQNFNGIPQSLLTEFKRAYDLAIKQENIGKKYFLHNGEYRIFDRLAQPTNLYTIELQFINCIHFKKDMRYLSEKYVSSLPYIVQKHSRLIGFSGSIGSKFERKFVEKLYSTIFFKIPPFLNCCKGQQPKQFAKLQDVFVEKNEVEQFKKIWKLAIEYSQRVPVLVIMADDKGVKEIMKIQQNCAKAIQITFSQYEKSLNQLQTLIRNSTERWDKFEFRITFTSPFGARGQDYRPIDPCIEENGGMMVILSHIPGSKREYIQFLGRVGRQDKKGQFYIVLNNEDCAQKYPNANLTLKKQQLIKELLKAGQIEIQKNLDKQQDSMEKGILMNQYSDEIYKSAGSLQDYNNENWISLVKNYNDMTINQIKEAYSDIEIDLIHQIPR